MFRCLLAVVVALLALQANNAQTTPSLSDLFTEAKNETDEAISQALSTGAVLQDKLGNVANEAHSQIHEEVESIISQVQSQVDATAQKYEQAGEYVAACTESVPAQLLELSTNITQSAIACATSKLEEAESIIVELFMQLEKANDTFASVQPSLAACQSDTYTAVACSLDVLTDAVTTSASIVNSVTSDTVKADTFVNTFESSVTTCKTKVYNAVSDEGATLVKGVQACYQGVFPNA